MSAVFPFTICGERPASLQILNCSMFLNSLITSNGYPSRWRIAASSIVSPFNVAPLSATASDTPPLIAPEIAPHLKPSLPESAAAFKASSKSLVWIPVTTPDASAPIPPEESAITVPVFADAAKTKLIAGAPTPPDTTETVTQIKMTPEPITTFLSACS